MILPVQFQRKLELAWIVCGCGLSGIGEERTDGGDVVDIGNVKHVRDQFQVEALAEVNAFRNPQIVEDCPRRDPGVAAEVAVEGDQSTVKVGNAWFLEHSGWRILRFNCISARRIYERIRS